jgi:hypothetical protein
LREFSDLVDLITLDLTIAHRYAKIRGARRGQGRLIPDNDLWIAATALAHQLTLVRRDRHFARIPALTLYQGGKTSEYTLRLPLAPSCFLGDKRRARVPYLASFLPLVILPRRHYRR